MKAHASGFSPGCAPPPGYSYPLKIRCRLTIHVIARHPLTGSEAYGAEAGSPGYGSHLMTGGNRVDVPERHPHAIRLSALHPLQIRARLT
jgi:hypothetical protein